MTTIYPHLNSVFLILFIFLSQSTSPSTSTLDSFVYAACSQLKYSTPGSGTPYSSIVNSLLSSTINSASVSAFNNFKLSLPGSGVVSGLFQCRGDLAASDCRECVASAVGRLVSSCAAATGGAVQLDGCYVRYDNASFVGEEDKAVVYHGCGMSIDDGGDADVSERRDDVAADLSAGVGQFFRVAGAGNVHGVAQCTQDLTAGECQDCLTEAIQRLRSQCGPSSPWGDMFLGKCYARYSERAYTPENGAVKMDGLGLMYKRSMRCYTGSNTLVVY